jgi:cytochrome c biogenesis protein CcdA
MVNAAALLIIATGLMLGLGHSLDPDHIVAVSTILCKCTSLRKSIVAATAWGAGHSITVLVVGLLVLALSVSIPESILRLFDAAAGAMLLVLGAILLRPIIAQKIHMRHHHLGEPSIGAHSHLYGSSHNHSHDHTHSHVHKSALTGALQGLAGSAALMLVTLTTVSSVPLGLAFIAVFGVGVILGMVCISLAISSVLRYTAARLEKVHEIISIVTGSISIGFGLFLILQVVLSLHIYS